jgi:hypothetical protein
LRKEDQLRLFKDTLGYLLIDTVMCAFHGRIPEELVESSGKEVLKDEVKRLEPLCILVLGNTALRGLKSFEPFTTCLAGIDSAVRKEMNGKVAPLVTKKCGDVRVVVSPFPNRFRNKKHWWQVEEAFREASRVANQSSRSQAENNSR